jgi:hypothetical protein
LVVNATKGWPLLVAALMLSASACAVGSPSAGGGGARPSVAMRKASALSFGAAPLALDPIPTLVTEPIATEPPATESTLPSAPVAPAPVAPAPVVAATLPVAPEAEPGAPGPHPHPHPASVVLVGDSLAQQAAPYLQPFFGPDELVRRAFAGTAPCDWLNTDLAIQPTSIVVISFSGNSFTPCMSDGAGAFLHGEDVVANYRVTVTALITEALSAGASVLLVGQPAFAVPQTPYNVVDGVNAMYRELAATNPVSFVDAGAAVENPDGSFASTLPCLPNESSCGASGTNVVRSDDGVHFCPGSAPPGECPVYASGAFRVAGAIEAAIRNI